MHSKAKTVFFVTHDKRIEEKADHKIIISADMAEFEEMGGSKEDFSKLDTGIYLTVSVVVQKMGLCLQLCCMR